MQRLQTVTHNSAPHPESLSAALKFPTIAVNGTPADWASHSQIVNMTSAHDESGDDTTSSLGDSSYDFVDDRSNITTDDEEQDAMTESTTSSNGNAFEPVHPHTPSSGQSDPVDRSAQSPTLPDIGQQGKSSESEAPAGNPRSNPQEEHDLQSHLEHGPIEFDEPSVINLKSSRFTEVSHTLEIIDRQNRLDGYYHELLHHLQGHLAVTVRQTMTCHSFTPKDGQYKVMYVGDSGAREPIIEKIGAALASTLNYSTSDSERVRSSKFNIVPISAFGGESSPEVILIDSSGLELTVEDCVHASFTRKETGNDSLRLELSNQTIINSSWNGSNFAVSKNWRLPDVAIFFLPDNDNAVMKRTRQFARSFMSRHKVLSIIISQSPTWETSPTEPLTLDYLTPHICLESRKSNLIHAPIIRRFPVDLPTFLNIDAGQMNRNLACLAAAPGSSKSKSNPDLLAHGESKSQAISNSWFLREALEPWISAVQKDGLRALSRYEYIGLSAFISIFLLGILLCGFGLSVLLGASRVSTSRVFPSQTNIPSRFGTSKTMSTPMSTVPLSLPSSSSAPRPPSWASTQVSPSKSLSINTDLASFLLDAYTLAPNKSEHFKVHVLGDCHIVLRPPHWFNKLKKSPKLLFKILRDQIELEHHTTTLFDGVYAVQIPREHAYGVLNLEVWTQSKPIVNENFEVDFGSSWLKVAGWRKAALMLSESIRRDLQSLQTSLSVVYDHAKTDVSTFMQQQRKKAIARRATDRDFLDTNVKAAVRTKKLIVAQTKGLQRIAVKRFYTTRSAALTGIRRKAESLIKDIVHYTQGKTSTITRQARLLACSTRGLSVKAPIASVGDFRRRHLKETQKRALRVWWSLKGPPRQRKIIHKAADRSP